MIRRGLPGWLVVAALAVNLGLYALMMFGTYAHLAGMAEGAEPFDLRPMGYGLGDARALLALLGEEGRAYYARVQLMLDTVYPATYAVSRGLLVWWLTAAGRIAPHALAIHWRLLMLVAPVAAAGFDYLENARIAAMLAAGTSVDAALVGAASLATQAKSAFTVVTEVLVLTLAFRFWRRRREQRGG